MKLCPKCQKQFSDDANFCPVDAARLVPAEVQSGQTDTLTARFTLADKLGGSRTGTVYRATDKQTNAQVAVKVVAPAVTGLPGVAQRLERELKQIERVQSAGVARVLASGKRGQGGDETWVAAELLDGAQTLSESITARGPLPLDAAAHLIEVVGEALIEAAQVGVVHRDLAPKNILFAGDQIKLINFSLPVPTTERVPGVAEFVAPEQVDGKPVDQRSNLYSLGALYYYVLTGTTPHGGSSPDDVHRAHANATIKTPSSLAPVPANVEAVIMRALDKSPTKRFLTVRQFVDEVSRIARGDTTDPKQTQPMGKVGKAKAELVQTLIGMRNPNWQPGAAVASIAAASPSPASTVAGVHPTPGHLSAPPMVQSVAVATPLEAPPAAPPAIGAATMMGVPSGVANAPTAASPVLAPDRSPWAPPSTEPPANVAPEMPAAAPVIPAVAPTIAPTVAPVVTHGPVAAAIDTAAPVAATMAPAPTPAMPMAPVLPQAPVVAPPKVTNAPAKPGGKDEPKGKFRETMWFKKGDLDAQAAVAAAEERARTGKEVAGDKADSLPIDERYKDDGSISRGDKDKYSLRTGATQMMSAVKGGDPASSMSGKVSEDALIGEMKGGRSMIFLFIGLGVIALALIIFMIVR